MQYEMNNIGPTSRAVQTKKRSAMIRQDYMSFWEIACKLNETFKRL